MLPLFPYDIAKVVTVCLHSKYLFSFYAKKSLFLIYINSKQGEALWNGIFCAFPIGFCQRFSGGRRSENKEKDRF